MSDSEEENMLLLTPTAAYYHLHNTVREKRQFSAHPLNQARLELGEFHHLYNSLRQDPKKFFEYMRMTSDTFDYILSKISDRLQHNWQNCHNRPILQEERLMLTIRYIRTNNFIGEKLTYSLVNNKKNEIF